MRPLEGKLVLDRRVDYDGTALRAHFIRSMFGVQGDGVVAFRGACDVRGASLVDLEDREAGAFIHSRDMVHFIVECFGADLPRMVFLQRVLAALAADRVRSSLRPADRAVVRRAGDDVFVDDGKLSVSIATLSTVSGLVHFGVNVDDQGTPVKTAALGPLGIDPGVFAQGIIDDLRAETASVIEALCKVAPAHDGSLG